MVLIVKRKVQPEDGWQRLPADLPDAQVPATASGVIVAAEQLPERSAALLPEQALGAWLTTEQDEHILLPWLPKLQLVVIEFLSFRDGRGMSLARLLRRAGYNGELRAAGEVARDRLGYMERCGFDAFVIPDERFHPDDLAAFTEVTVSYQASQQQETSHASR